VHGRGFESLTFGWYGGGVHGRGFESFTFWVPRCRLWHCCTGKNGYIPAKVEWATCGHFSIRVNYYR
jgi:hypothetical protein